MELLPKVYIAGAYSADNVLAMLRNMREGMKLAERVFATGKAAPFVPWFDWQFEMFGDHDVSTYYKYSLTWLVASDIMLIRRYASENSTGTQNEIEAANRYGVKIFYDDEWPQFVEYLNGLYERLKPKEQPCASTS